MDDGDIFLILSVVALSALLVCNALGFFSSDEQPTPEYTVNVYLSSDGDKPQLIKTEICNENGCEAKND